MYLTVIATNTFIICIIALTFTSDQASCLPDITTMLSDIVEKDVSSPAKAPAPPTAPSHGFPAPKMRSKFKSSRQKTDRAAPSTWAIATAASTVLDQSIDSENRNVITKMSPQEILEEQADIEEKLGPKMVEFLRKRAETSAARDVSRVRC